MPGIGIDTRQRQRARSGLGQRAAAADRSADGGVAASGEGEAVGAECDRSECQQACIAGDRARRAERDRAGEAVVARDVAQVAEPADPVAIEGQRLAGDGDTALQTERRSALHHGPARRRAQCGVVRRDQRAEDDGGLPGIAVGAGQGGGGATRQHLQ